VVSAGSGVRKEEWSAKCRVEWFRRGSINVEWSVIGEVGSCTAPYYYEQTMLRTYEYAAEKSVGRKSCGTASLQ
jgi:hypothetical protein